MAGVEACSGCHQFMLPDFHAKGRPDTDIAMQDTVREWQLSSFGRKGVPCQSCHMPEGAHDLRFMRAHLEVEWSDPSSREGGPLCAAVRSTEVGHAVPTGDPFRRLQLRLCADVACETTIASRVLGRSVTASPTSSERCRRT